MGVAEALKQVYPEVRIVAVEPAESAVMIGEEPGSHIIQGIGPGFIPSLVNMDLIDEVTYKDCPTAWQKLKREIIGDERKRRDFVEKLKKAVH